MASEDLFIGGKWLTGYGKTLFSRNPATYEIVYQCSMASTSDIDRAVRAAQAALHDWQAIPFEDKVSYLHRFKNELETSKDSLIEAICLETGKPKWDAMNEYQAVLGKIDISIESYGIRCAEMEQAIAQGILLTRHKPHGVIAVLGPFNFPAHLPNGHIVPALLAGNCVVFKPSDYTPLTAKVLIECWERTGIPPGVINMIQGGKETGKTLADHEGINGLFFTGSFAVGEALTHLFANKPGKILALELGGNNPLVVTNKVQSAQSAAVLAIQSAFLSAGQRCTCARRLIIPEGSWGDQLIEILKQYTENLRIGIYTDDPEPFMGPVIDEAAALRLLSTQASLIAKGAYSLLPLEHLKKDTGLVTPGIIDVTSIKERPDEEYFGPLLQVIRVPNFSTALQEANQTAYGLVAGLLSEDYQEWKEFYAKVKAGVMNWNAPTTGASSSAPFGGIGKSGNFRPSAFYAADYCSYPVASMMKEQLTLPAKLPEGLEELKHA
ncbi:MAG: succinylglutamate-semialdehyde dehydrogenase [Chlamydiales bacterium]